MSEAGRAPAQSRGATEDPPAAYGLERSLNLPQSITIVTGGIIGVSIFLVPAAVANTAGHPLLALGVWLLAAVLSASAALTFAELGAAIPETGGTYVFLRRAYGKALAFFYGWMVLCGYGAAALAIVAIMASRYALRLVPEPLSGHGSATIVAFGFIMVSATVNMLGIARGGRLQFFLTVLKVLMILVLISIPLSLGAPDLNIFSMRADPPLDGKGIMHAVSEGLLLSLFSYSGAHFVTQVAGEMRYPARDIPWAIIIGFGIVAALYLALNFTYIVVLPFDEFRHSDAVAVDIMTHVIGPVGGYLVAVAIVISALAVLNAQLMGYPRVVFALAADGLLPSWVARVHKRTHAPWAAVLTVVVASMFYILSGSYQTILAAVAFVSHAFVTFSVAAVLVLRWKEPELPRPYKVRFYPWAPVAFIIFSMLYLGSLLVSRPLESLTGVAIVASGLPIYLWMRYKSAEASEDGSATSSLAET